MFISRSEPDSVQAPDDVVVVGVVADVAINHVEIPSVRRCWIHRRAAGGIGRGSASLGRPPGRGRRGRSSMVEPQSSKLATRVRFPSPAPRRFSRSVSCGMPTGHRSAWTCSPRVHVACDAASSSPSSSAGRSPATCSPMWSAIARSRSSPPRAAVATPWLSGPPTDPRTGDRTATVRTRSVVSSTSSTYPMSGSMWRRPRLAYSSRVRRRTGARRSTAARTLQGRSLRGSGRSSRRGRRHLRAPRATARRPSCART